MSQFNAIRSSAALMVAVVALVAALGGGAVAGVTISKLSNKEKKQVKRLSKRQAKKLDRSIELTPGPQGEPGPRGEQGIPGQNAAENVVVRESGLSSGQRTVSCQGGERVVGGGASTSQPAALTVDAPIVASDGTATGWMALADDNAPTNAYVLCASP